MRNLLSQSHPCLNFIKKILIPYFLALTHLAGGVFVAWKSYFSFTWGGLLLALGAILSGLSLLKWPEQFIEKPHAFSNGNLPNMIYSLSQVILCVGVSVVIFMSMNLLG